MLYRTEAHVLLEEDWRWNFLFFVQIPEPERRKVSYRSRNTAGGDKRREGKVQMSRWSRQIAFTGTDLRLEEEIQKLSRRK